MKKNTFMRVASALLVAVLLTTCAIAGTFAKYTTSDNSTDSARVAKFGVVIEADFGELFLGEYDTTEAWTGDDGVSVKSTADVIAPGTNGSLADFAVSGTPEVDVQVAYEATLTLEGWVVEGDYYCPIEITVNTVVLKGKDYASADLFAAAVKAEIEKSAKKYNSGTDLSTVVAGDLEVTWEWKFDGNNDTKDTALGDAAAAGSAATIQLDVSCTITQID